MGKQKNRNDDKSRSDRAKAQAISRRKARKSKEVVRELSFAVIKDN